MRPERKALVRTIRTMKACGVSMNGTGRKRQELNRGDFVEVAPVRFAGEVEN